MVNEEQGRHVLSLCLEVSPMIEDDAWASQASWTSSQSLYSFLKDISRDGIRVSYGLPDSGQGGHSSAKGMANR